MKRMFRLLVIVLPLLLSSGVPLQAHEDCCQACGCCANCSECCAVCADCCADCCDRG